MERYIKETVIVDKKDSEKMQDFKNSILGCKKNLQKFYTNLKFADGDLIDYYIYQIKAEEAKYDYLLKKYKNL